jgi:multidrug resistance efflux pump
MYAQPGPAPTQGHAVDQKALQDLVERAQTALQALEFSQAVTTAENLEDIFLLITNDIRAILPFDRSFLITHLGGKSGFIAAGGLASPEKKSRFYKEISILAKAIRPLDRSIFVATDQIGKLAEFDISPNLQKALQRFTSFSSCTNILFVPLKRMGVVMGHLVFEFLEGTAVDRNSITVVQYVEPTISLVVAEKWLQAKKPGLTSILIPKAGSGKNRLKVLGKKIAVAVAVAAVVTGVLFGIPFQYTVGGEAEVMPGEHYYAFSKIEGLIDRIYVQEGHDVKKGAVLARLDPKDLDFKILTLHRELDILTKEMNILSDGAASQTSKLARAEIVELNRKKKIKELEYLKSQREFLEIKAPVSGTVVTKNIQSLAGKRLGLGEAFCELAVHSELAVDVYVPEDRVTRVQKGQPVAVYLNSDPTKAYNLTITEIAPRAEVTQRLGNIFRAKAEFFNAPDGAVVGMKGIGKIHTGTSSLWGMIVDRVMTRWHSFTAAI